MASSFAQNSRRNLRFWLARSHPEAGKLVAFAAAQFLLGLGFGSGFFAANALLISRAGTAPLLYIYVGSSIFSLALAITFYFLSDRYPRKKTFLLSFWAQGLGMLMLWAWIVARPGELWPLFLMRIYLYGVFTLTTMQIWLLAADYFNHFEARRWFPLLVSAGIVGDSAGGFAASFLASRWGSINLILIWAGALAVCPLLLMPLRRGRNQEARHFKQEHPSFPEVLYPKNLAVMLLIFWLAYSFFAYGVDYLYNARALAVLGSADELAAFFGRVTLVASAVVLVYQLFFATRLAQRWGMDRLVFGIPIVFIVGTGLLHFLPGLLPAAVAESMVFFFVEFAAVSLLQPIMNLYPQGMRGRVKMITEGVGRPAGILLLLGLGGLGPLLVSSFSFPTALFGAALLFMAFPFFFKAGYRAHLRALLHSPETHLVANAVQALGEPNKKDMAPELCRLLRDSESLDLKKTIVLSLGRIQSGEAFRDIVDIFSVKDEALQLAVLESLGSYNSYQSIHALFGFLKSEQNVSFQVRMNSMRLLTKLVGKKMVPFLLDSLEDADPRVRANALESIGLLKDRKAIPLLLPYLDDPNNRVKANAAIALTPFRQTRSQARKVVVDLFNASALSNRLSGIYAIGESGWAAAEGEVRPLLISSEKKLRQHAAVALAKLGIPEFRETFLELLMDSETGAALETARHILRFPGSSRMLLFEGIARLSRAQRDGIFARLEQTSLDFSVEKNLLWEEETEDSARQAWSGCLIPHEIG